MLEWERTSTLKARVSLKLTKHTSQCAQTATGGALVSGSLLPFIFSHHILTSPPQGSGSWEIFGNIWIWNKLLKLQ